MGVRITDLRERVRLIAKEFVDCGFSMTDLLSIGLLFLEGKTPNEIAELRKLINQPLKDKHQKPGKLGDESPVVNVEESIQNIRYFVKFKLPSPAEKRLLNDLRKALEPELPRRKRRKKA